MAAAAAAAAATAAAAAAAAAATAAVVPLNVKSEKAYEAAIQRRLKGIQDASSKTDRNGTNVVCTA